MKVDRYVIQASTCDTLSRYLQHPGDQLAVQSFCSKEPVSVRESKRTPKHRKILSSLRRKLLLHNKHSRDSHCSDSEDSEGHNISSMPKSNLSKGYLRGNKNAIKITRKIELGWLHMENDSFLQIRKKRGGGTRRIDIPKDAAQSTILEAAKALFFHCGSSPLGNVNDFSFDLCDYSETPMGSSLEIVGQMYKRTGSNMLRFYMSTKKKSEVKFNEESIQVAEDTLPDLHSQPFPAFSSVDGNSDEEVFFNFKHVGAMSYTPPSTISGQDIVQRQTSVQSLSLSTTYSRPPPVLNSAADSPIEMFPLTSPHTQTLSNIAPEESFNYHVQTTISATGENDGNILPLAANIDTISDADNFSVTGFVTPSTPPASFELVIHRGSLAFTEMCGYFKDPTITDRSLIVVRILPNGEKEMAEDTGGVLRDLLADFWGEFYNRCSLGRTVKVPSLRHDFGAEEWQAIGRVLIFGWQNVGYWPTSLSKTFFKFCLFPEIPVSNEDLLSDFKNYVSEADQTVFEMALNSFDDVDEMDLVDSLQSYDCRTRVNQENIKPVLLEIAHKELIQHPTFVSNRWFEILKECGLTLQKIEDMYSYLIPTNKKVLQILIFPEMTDQTKDTDKYLKKYVRELSETKLRRFLRFCTGADVVVVPRITVAYVKQEGLARRPVSHTCGCILELSDHFDNFMEFRSEFDGVLDSNVWIMDIV